MADALSAEKGSFAAVTVDVAAGLDVLSASVASGLELMAYWEQPQTGLAAAALGCVAVRTAADAASTHSLIARLAGDDEVHWQGTPSELGPWFGGVAFDLGRTPGGAWAGFPVSRWILPELLLVRSGDRVQLVGFAACPADALEDTFRDLASKLQSVAPRLAGPARFRETPGVRTLSEDRSGWEKLLQSALRAIDGERLQKVVTARAVRLECGGPVPVPTVLNRFRQTSPGCTTFLVRGEDGSAFLGATPELLCAVDQERVETVALGGSRLGEDPNWPTDKELREHRAIVDGISLGLGPLCAELNVSLAPRELRLPTLSHLHTPIRGKLRPETGVAEVVRALHPTPAVGGAPRARALEFLRDQEGLERGWYAGAVGWVGARRAELRVALRCVLVRNDQAQVFVGAGIVAGSDPAAEWNETVVKAQVALSALGVVEVRRAS